MSCICIAFEKQMVLRTKRLHLLYLSA
jgi:hypothetical protein